MIEPEVPETERDPINNTLVDVLVKLPSKPQPMTIQPVTTAPLTFDCVGASHQQAKQVDLEHGG